MAEDFKDGFLKTLWLLRNYLSLIVIGGGWVPLSYIFHKGLIFERRNDRRKKAKDLYYIFDILANCPELKEGVTEGLREFKKKYRSWFSTFARNLQMRFSDPEADGALMVLSQRPSGAFPAMTGEQFKQYAAGLFQALLSEITSGDG